MTSPPIDAIDASAGLPLRHRRRPFAPAAAVLVAAAFLLPILLGVNEMQARPSPECMEYCGGSQAFANIMLGLGIVGLAMAVAIWRRHLSAQAIALCLCVCVVVIAAIIFGTAVLASDPVTAIVAMPVPFGLVAFFGVTGLLLGAAIYQSIEDPHSA